MSLLKCLGAPLSSNLIDCSFHFFFFLIYAYFLTTFTHLSINGIFYLFFFVWKSFHNVICFCLSDNTEYFLQPTILSKWTKNICGKAFRKSVWLLELFSSCVNNARTLFYSFFPLFSSLLSIAIFHYYQNLGVLFPTF
jgi:hypothetical protein